MLSLQLHLFWFAGSSLAFSSGWIRAVTRISVPLLLGDVTKFGRGDSASPAPPTTLAQAQQSQSQAHHTPQQPFLNPALPHGYSYTGLPYYTGVPSAFQYGPTMFVSICGNCNFSYGEQKQRERDMTPLRVSSGLQECLGWW